MSPNPTKSSSFAIVQWCCEGNGWDEAIVRNHMVQSNRNKFAISDKFSIGDGGVISNRRLVQVSYYLKSRDKYIHKAAEAFLEYDTIQQIRKGTCMRRW